VLGPFRRKGICNLRLRTLTLEGRWLRDTPVTMNIGIRNADCCADYRYSEHQKVPAIRIALLSEYRHSLVALKPS
jgi:hypothetical protein